jgi:hypothetical protein
MRCLLFCRPGLQGVVGGIILLRGVLNMVVFWGDYLFVRHVRHYRILCISFVEY